MTKRLSHERKWPLLQQSKINPNYPPNGIFYGQENINGANGTKFCAHGLSSEQNSTYNTEIPFKKAKVARNNGSQTIHPISSKFNEPNSLGEK